MGIDTGAGPCYTRAMATKRKSAARPPDPDPSPRPPRPLPSYRGRYGSPYAVGAPAGESYFLAHLYQELADFLDAREAVWRYTREAMVALRLDKNRDR